MPLSAEIPECHSSGNWDNMKRLRLSGGQSWHHIEGFSPGSTSTNHGLTRLSIIGGGLSAKGKDARFKSGVLKCLASHSAVKVRANANIDRPSPTSSMKAVSVSVKRKLFDYRCCSTHVPRQWWNENITSNDMSLPRCTSRFPPLRTRTPPAFLSAFSFTTTNPPSSLAPAHSLSSF